MIYNQLLLEFISMKCKPFFAICYAGDDENMEISAPMMFEQYVVTADYQKKNKNDISLTAGDIIDVIERNDYGETQDKLFISWWI